MWVMLLWFAHKYVWIVVRIGEPDERFLCDSKTITVYPKTAKSKDNKWKYIINQGQQDGYVQGVRVEMCER